MLRISIFLILFFLCCCSYKPEFKSNKAQIRNHNGKFLLLVNDEPYFIKGAVAWQRFELVAKYGGNGVRSGCRKNILDQSDSFSLKNLVNLPVRPERDGFDYNDSALVHQQFDRVIALVDSFRIHPAVLMWALGNELDWIPPGIPYNRKMWTEVNRMAKKIHEIDPYHPVLTVIGSADEEKIREIITLCPDLDLIGLNEYGDILDLPGNLRKWGWKKPYVITEWGPTGFWQVPLTDWGVPVEETSTEKAILYKKRYEEAILKDDSMCLGSYVFLWNQHQERTHTWFGMFDEHWRETEAVDVMKYEWTGKWPPNTAPRIDSILLDNRKAIESIRLESTKIYEARVFSSDPENDPLQFDWEVLKEGTDFPYGGRGETRPEAVPDLFVIKNSDRITFQSPRDKGAYRLFLYVYDNHNHFSTANIPFYVETLN